MNDPLLARISSPEDLKALSLNELNGLAQEARQRIIQVMAKNGGHLASNLGTVELTIALHKVFHSPEDKFVWDVGHQTYTHKLLTGRQARFDTIRKYHGLCGFSHPDESPHDHFHAGHAGTALSLALGMAKRRDLLKEPEFIISVIGDATLTCGTALEAMNNIPQGLKRFIVILNDNQMSISKNVGAITHILSRMLSNPTTHKLYQEIDHLLSKIPALGESLSKQGKKLTESLKNLVSPASFFEHYGLSYIGPIDGHDIKKVIDTLEGVKDSEWPVLIHVATEKGRGMAEASKDPTTYHGARPFNPSTGKLLPNPSVHPTFPKLFGQFIAEMGNADEKLVAITPAMSAGSCLDTFMREHPERCIDVGMAESHSVTFAGGLAHSKELKVLVSIYSTFLQRGLDNVFHDICLQQIPVVFAIDRSGLAGGDGATHNGIYDISFLRSMPNMVIAQPRNGDILKQLLNSAFSYQAPTAIRYPNLATTYEETPLLPRALGQGDLLFQGKDLLLIGLGHMANVAMEVRELLKEKGILATVIDPVFVKPLDEALLLPLFKEHSCLVTMEEHSLAGGLGSAINTLVAKGHWPLHVLNLGIPESFIEQGSHAELMQEIGLTAPQIAEKILQTFAFCKDMAASSI